MRSLVYDRQMSETQLELEAQITPPKVVRNAISELYAAFRTRKLSKGGPDACTASCCASREVLNRIARSAPMNVSFEDLREYHSAAKGLGAGEDLAFLLPRILQFVAQGRDPNGIGLFALFGSHFSPMWDELSDHERAAVRQYCSVLMRWRIATYSDKAPSYEPWDLLEMAAAGGFDVDPILDAFTPLPSTNGAVDLLIDLILHRADIWRDEQRIYGTDTELTKHIAERLCIIITSPEALLLLESAALADNDLDRAERASLAHQIVEHKAENEVRNW